ncbi:MFS transporter [Saxibacter everestensis]|uniref:MFS transporter n=1 Tax=Saxibacter everestensis TaxID=2909229 RepID=A0ABY8QXY5_9MICO|nr:MFS transporter [Brevibacteriaceae bacterium ZFBP1038]
MTIASPIPKSPRSEAQRRSGRQIVAASVGNVVEWYDWYTYSFLAVFFSAQIFHTDDKVASLLSSFAVFAVGFFMRPVGGLVLGSLADKLGRKNILTLTILLMGASSLLIAIVPTYAQVGVLSPILLVLARLIGGFSVGGEFAANSTFLVESAPPGRRGLFASFQYVSTTIGQLIASGFAAILAVSLSSADLTSWGWRLPFVLGAVLSLVGLVIRRTASETTAVPEKKQDRPKLFEAIIHHPKASLLICGVTIAGTIAYYTWTTYLPTYAQQNGGVDPAKALLVSTIALIFFALIQPVFGILSDRVGRKPLLLAFSGIFALGIVPALAYVRSGPSFAGLLLLTLAGMVVVTGYTSIGVAVNAELFPARVRAAGIGFPYSLTVAAFGGTAPFMGTLFKDVGRPELFGWYAAALAVVSFIVYLRMAETARKELD